MHQVHFRCFPSKYPGFRPKHVIKVDIEIGGVLNFETMSPSDIHNAEIPKI